MSVDYMLAKMGQRMDVPGSEMVALGDPDEVRASISHFFPELDWSNHRRAPSVGLVCTEDRTFEFCLHYERMHVDWEKIAQERRLPTDEEVANAHCGDGAIIMVAVHFGQGLGFIEQVEKMCLANTWTLWDMQTGDIFDFAQKDQHGEHKSKIDAMVRRLHD